MIVVGIFVLCSGQLTGSGLSHPAGVNRNAEEPIRSSLPGHSGHWTARKHRYRDKNNYYQWHNRYACQHPPRPRTARTNTANKQVPQHVTTLLSHLTSRPGVQSTLILSRRDGSIIQSTGVLAESLAGRAQTQTQTQTHTHTPTPTGLDQTQPEQKDQAEQSTGPNAETESSSSTPTGEEQPQGGSQSQSQAYQPSHAETLAAHIFSFVSSASDLSVSLSHPEGGLDSAAVPDASTNGTSTTSTPTAPPANGTEEEDQNYDDDEVKLLRLRTRKHEIVVVPDRKYLLCVVQDAVVRR